MLLAMCLGEDWKCFAAVVDLDLDVRVINLLNFVSSLLCIVNYSAYTESCQEIIKVRE